MNEQILAAAFEIVLERPIQVKAVIPTFVMKYILPLVTRFNENIEDMYEMIKWIDTGVYVSKNSQQQKELFGELPPLKKV